MTWLRGEVDLLGRVPAGLRPVTPAPARGRVDSGPGSRGTRGATVLRQSLRIWPEAPRHRRVAPCRGRARLVASRVPQALRSDLEQFPAELTQLAL